MSEEAEAGQLARQVARQEIRQALAELAMAARSRITFDTTQLEDAAATAVQESAERALRAREAAWAAEPPAPTLQEWGAARAAVRYDAPCGSKEPHRAHRGFDGPACPGWPAQLVTRAFLASAPDRGAFVDVTVRVNWAAFEELIGPVSAEVVASLLEEALKHSLVVDRVRLASSEKEG